MGREGFLVEEAILSVCFTVSVLLPRPDPTDASFFGGVNFSRPFRQGVFGLTLALVLRATLLPDITTISSSSSSSSSRLSFVYYSWACGENILRNFLRLLVPYLLQRQLASIRHGILIPGENLQRCFYFIIFMNVLALVCSGQSGEQDRIYFWGILIFQDAMVSIILIRTFGQYNRAVLTARNNNNNNRQEQQEYYTPSMLLRTIVVLEWAQLILSVSEEWGFGLIGRLVQYVTTNGSDSSNNKNPWSRVILPRILMQHVLILMHANLMNSIDEQEYYRATTRTHDGDHHLEHGDHDDEGFHDGDGREHPWNDEEVPPQAHQGNTTSRLSRNRIV
ncbi:hypothetical protein ACA910_015621 [Epithemia clementina (nom. ined.)]